MQSDRFGIWTIIVAIATVAGSIVALLAYTLPRSGPVVISSMPQVQVRIVQPQIPAQTAPPPISKTMSRPPLAETGPNDNSAPSVAPPPAPVFDQTPSSTEPLAMPAKKVLPRKLEFTEQPTDRP